MINFALAMLKQIASILVILVFTSGLLNSNLLLLNYALNKESITELFCVNKEQPELKCDGKCHLGKQLNETTDSPDSPTIPEVRTFSEFVSTPISFEFPVCNVESRVQIDFNYFSCLSDGFKVTLVPPPWFS